MTMTLKLNNDNGLQDWKTEHLAVTGDIFYCRDSAGFSVSASNKFSCNLTGQCFEIGNKNIPQAVGNKAVNKSNEQNINENNGLRLIKEDLKHKRFSFFVAHRRKN